MEIVQSVLTCITPLIKSSIPVIRDLIHLDKKGEKMLKKLEELDDKKNDARNEIETSGKKAKVGVKKLMQELERIREHLMQTQKKIEEEKQKGCIRACPKFWYRFKILHRLNKLDQEIKNQNWEELNAPFGTVPSLTFLPVETDYILKSFEKKSSEIEKLLLEDGQEVRFIGVWGREGVGKTTLLSLLYNSDNIREAFDDYIFWVSSLSGDMEKARKSIANQLGYEDDSPSHLYSNLRKKKFLLIVDGMRERGELLKLPKTLGLPSLREGKHKMVFTCLSEYVVSTVEGAKAIELKGLKEEEGWELFCRKAFGGRSVPSEMEETAQKMVKDCQGLPSLIHKLANEFESCQNESIVNRFLSWRIKLSFLSLGHSGVGKIAGFFCSFLLLVGIIICFFPSWPSDGRSESSKDKKENNGEMEENTDESSQGKGEKKPPEDHGPGTSWSKDNEGTPG